MSEAAFDDKELAVIEKVRKLLNLARDKGAHEAEAETATKLAMQLLEAYNLDMSAVERATGSGKRSDSHLKGGLYKWQRELWEQVAKLNFCMYWSEKGLTKGSAYQHRILGSRANVVSTQVMAEYLQDAIEKAAREWVGVTAKFFTKSAISYREGMAGRICQRLAARREDQRAEARRAKAEDAARSRHPGAATGTALVLIDDVEREENDANMDFLYGEGYTARQKAARAEAEARYQDLMEKRRKWEEENPEEHARQQAEANAANEKWRKKSERNAKRRKGTQVSYTTYKGDANAYQAGSRKGNDIGLDRQVKHTEQKRL